MTIQDLGCRGWIEDQHPHGAEPDTMRCTFSMRARACIVLTIYPDVQPAPQWGCRMHHCDALPCCTSHPGACLPRWRCMCLNGCLMQQRLRHSCRRALQVCSQAVKKACRCRRLCCSQGHQQVFCPIEHLWCTQPSLQAITLELRRI